MGKANVIVPMAGLGTRVKEFDNILPKPLIT